jgi:hypothetical protein
MNWPTSVPLQGHHLSISTTTALNEGTEYMKDPINTTELIITCWIYEKCRDEMDLEFHFPRCTAKVPDYRMCDGLTGHTLSNADRTTIHPCTNEGCPKVHCSPANVDTKARPR